LCCLCICFTTGWAGTFTLSSGQCTLTRVPAPLKLDYVLACTEPGLVLQTRPPRYTSRFVSAAAANSEVSSDTVTVSYTCDVSHCLLRLPLALQPIDLSLRHSSSHGNPSNTPTPD
jgi:hypothetical protein